MGSTGAGPARSSPRDGGAVGGISDADPEAVSAASVGGYWVATVAAAGAGVGTDSRHAGPSQGFGVGGTG